MKKASVFFLCALAVVAVLVAAPRKLAPVSVSSVKINKPADMCANVSGGTVYVLCSEDGVLEYSTNGGMNVSAVVEGTNVAESIHADEKNIYMINNGGAWMSVVDKETGEVITNISAPENALEGEVKAFTVNAKSGKFVVISADTSTIQEIDTNTYTVSKTVEKPKGIEGEITAAAAHGKTVYALSAEAGEVYELNPNTYNVSKTWTIDADNPKALSFDADGNMIVISEDEGGAKRDEKAQKNIFSMYTYKNPNRR